MSNVYTKPETLGGERPFVLPPCYDYRYFYGVIIVTVNDPMADGLSSALVRSQVKHPMLEAVAKDIVGGNVAIEFPESDDAVPSYVYTYFRNCGTLHLNKSACALLASAIEESGGDRPVARHLWSLMHHLQGRPKGNGNEQEEDAA